jgi:hypothetical protein
LIIQGEGVRLFIYLFIQLSKYDPELLDFGQGFNNLAFSRFSPALAKMLLACTKGYGFGLVFLNLQ